MSVLATYDQHRLVLYLPISTGHRRPHMVPNVLARARVDEAKGGQRGVVRLSFIPYDKTNDARSSVPRSAGKTVSPSITLVSESSNRSSLPPRCANRDVFHDVIVSARQPTIAVTWLHSRKSLLFGECVSGFSEKFPFVNAANTCSARGRLALLIEERSTTLMNDFTVRRRVVGFRSSASLAGMRISDLRRFAKVADLSSS